MIAKLPEELEKQMPTELQLIGQFYLKSLSHQEALKSDPGETLTEKA